MCLKHILGLTPKVLVVILLVTAGCTMKRGPQSGATSPGGAPAATSQVAGLPPLPAGKHGAIIADPNPIKVCDGSGLGITDIVFRIELPVRVVDVRVGSPAGAQLTSKGESARVPTGKWVTDGMVFYLQDTTSGKSLTPENTLATVTASVTQEGCQ